MLFLYRFANTHPDIMREYCYIVEAESRHEADKRIKNVDGKMDASEAAVEELEMVSNHVAYAPEINARLLK